jgi:diacylglycerol kinase (ATP)
MAQPRPRESKYEHLRQQAALPGRGGIARIKNAFWNTIGGLREGMRTEAAIKQEIAVLLVALPAPAFVATGLWVWVAMIGSLLLLLAIEFLNTAIERLCQSPAPG